MNTTTKYIAIQNTMATLEDCALCDLSDGEGGDCGHSPCHLKTGYYWRALEHTWTASCAACIHQDCNSPTQCDMHPHCILDELNIPTTTGAGLR